MLLLDLTDFENLKGLVDDIAKICCETVVLEVSC